MNLNNVIIGGTLGKDPEVRYLANGTAICDLAMAINRNWKGTDGSKQEEVSWIDITFFGPTADVIAQHFSKGGQIVVIGRLKQDTWEDRQSGAKRSKVKVIGERFEFANRNSGSEGGGEQFGPDQNRPAREQAAQNRGSGQLVRRGDHQDNPDPSGDCYDGAGGGAGEDDEIPF